VTKKWRNSCQISNLKMIGWRAHELLLDKEGTLTPSPEPDPAFFPRVNRSKIAGVWRGVPVTLSHLRFQMRALGWRGLSNLAHLLDMTAASFKWQSTGLSIRGRRMP
jgi:hypothetical protein